MTDKKTCLVLCRESDDAFKLRHLKNGDGAFKKLIEDHSITFSHFDEFTEGIFHDTFDFVIVSLDEEDLTADDLSMQSECLEHYTKAPVFAWSLSKGEVDGLKAEAAKFHAASDVKFFDQGDGAARSSSFVESFNWCVDTYNKKSDGEVKTAFAKFDHDNSNSIDQKELQTLSTQLGFELTEAEAATAMVDLDLNGDGTIDFSEFKRWYFSGMKAYSGSKRTMLKIGKTTVSLIDAIKGDAKASLKGELKVRSHKIQVGFNTPTDPGTSATVDVYPVGPTHNNFVADLKGKYDSTFHADNFKALGAEKHVNAYGEVRIQMAEDASSAAERLTAAYNEVVAAYGMGSVIPFVPKAYAEGNTLVIGTMCPVPDEGPVKNAKVPAEIASLLSNVDQSVKVKFNLGASVAKIFGSPDPVITHGVDGFGVTAEVNLVSNLKEALFNQLKEDSSKDLASVLMAFGPLFLLQVNGQLDLKFEDFDDLKSHPMMEPFMANLSELLDGLFTADLETLLTERVELDTEVSDSLKDSEDYKMVVAEAKLCHTALEIFNEMGSEVSTVEIKACWERMATMHVNLKSQALGSALTLGLILGYYRTCVKPTFEWLVENA
mmetsp:Transcript_13163/g.20460  ORF Transcript_13163/g.20460 Transcript_13163/m.20460 type:complete len:605 (+) Transcript_13163:18-1832(+)